MFECPVDELRNQVKKNVIALVHAVGVVNVEISSFLPSALDRGRWCASRTGRIALGEELRYPLNTRPGSSQSRSGYFGEKKNFFPGRDSNPCMSSPWASRYTIALSRLRGRNWV